jgi:hypothetical protein
MTTDNTGLSFHFISFGQRGQEAALSCLQYTYREGFDFLVYRCIASKNRFLNRLYRFIAGKICSYRQKCRFIAQNKTNCTASSRGKSYYLEICIASSVTKILAKKLYRFIRFFSQKLCICIALNDTFLSIAAHHWQEHID